MIENELIKIKRTELRLYSHLKSKTEWYKQGFRVKSDVKPKYYASQQFTGDIYYLYEQDQCVPKKKLSEKQRKQAIENLNKSKTCVVCHEVQYSHFDLNEEKICFYCIKEKEKKQIEDEVATKFKSWLDEKEKYLILDTETTGLSYDDELIEIGVIDLDGNTKFHTRIKPVKNKVSDRAYEVHGISNDMLINQPTFSDVFDDLINLIENKTLLIYNAPFDLRMLQQSCNEIELERLNGIVLSSECVMRTMTTYFGYDRWCSLQDCCWDLRLELEQNHKALDDCMMVLEVIKAVINQSIS